MDCVVLVIEIIELLIKRGANDWDEGLKYACKGGHKRIVELMLEKGATNLNKGLRHLYIDNKKIAFLLIEKGADINNCRIDFTFDDIYYLYEKGIKSFGKYDKIIYNCMIRYVFDRLRNLSL